MQYLTDPEAIELYNAWLARVADLVRRAHAKANGRRNTDTADLNDLREDLAAVNLHSLEIEEPDAAPGTALAAAQAARRFLTFAEDDHGKGEHLAAILWLQASYMAANLALELDKNPRAANEAIDPGADPDDPRRFEPETPPADLRPGTPGHVNWFHAIPKQRTNRKPKQQ